MNWIFKKMVKGLENWHDKYNADMEGVHQELANKANRKQPDEYDLVLVEGVANEYESKYWINSFGEVGIYLSIQPISDMEITTRQQIAVLPEGFRPRYRFAFSCVYFAAGGVRYAGSIDILPDGTIYFYGGAASPQIIAGSAVFLAR